jgi:hypothetical protein
VLFVLSANTETKKRENNGPLKLEVQLQPSVLPKPYPSKYQPQNQQNVQLINPSSSTSFPEPFETIKPHLNPALNHQIYQQHQIDLNPTYSPMRDPNVLDPQTLNAILHHQYFQQQNPEIYGFRQNGDGSVSTYTSQTSSQNRPPFFNWFGLNNNNNNNNYQNQNDQSQQGPIQGFLTNLVNNNPLTTFINSFQPQNEQQQSQNPFQNIISNLNPLNLFSNNNNRPQTSQNLPIQSDYVSTVTPMSPSNQYLSNNIDSSVFSNDHFLNPTQLPPTSGNFNPYNNPSFNPNYNPSFNPNFNNPGSNFNNPSLSVNYNPLTPVYNPNYGPGLAQAYVNPFSTTNRPGINQQFHGNVQPYSQFSHQNPSAYPVYQNPYQVISPISVTSNPNYHRKKTSNKNGKKKNNKNKVDVPETKSDWFRDFLDKRKEANLDVSSRKPTKKSSDEDDDSDLDDYFR